MCTRYDFRTELTLNDVENLNDSFGLGFGESHCNNHIGLEGYFGPRYSHRPLMTPDYDEGEIKYYIDYYCQLYSNSEHLLISHPKVINAAQEVFNTTRNINPNYTDIVGWLQIIHQNYMDFRIGEKTKTNIDAKNEIKYHSMTYNDCPFGFANTPHTDKKVQEVKNTDIDTLLSNRLHQTFNVNMELNSHNICILIL